ncbi:hypothetical protein N577_011275 [Lacticaseibacillus rhamnosus 2166]|nr:hypothetical protein N577_011275 [Lacticaseibacillus rhamnosus 2166]
MRQYPVSSQLQLVTFIPDYAVSTAEARKILPTTMTYADAAYQMGRCVLMTRALADGDLPLLHQVAHDRMQEPYRATLIPDYQAVRQLVTAANGVLLISGSGSTCLQLWKEQRLLASCKQPPANNGRHGACRSSSRV